MVSTIEVLFSPAEFSALKPAALADTTCVVFDVLRATTSITVALENGASAIFPVIGIEDALKLRADKPNALLAGERDGVLIRAAQTGGVDFDLGNSPREFTAERVRGREIIMTTTNGTRALQACQGAFRILAGSILNLDALAERLQKNPRLLIVCAGTYEEAAYEDTWAAGALVDLLSIESKTVALSDSAQIALDVFRATKDRPEEAWDRSSNARKLLANPALREDVAVCWQRNCSRMIGEMWGNRVTPAS